MRLVAAILLCLAPLSAPVARADEVGSKPPQLAPLPSWTGFYAGVNAGGLWSTPGASSTVDWSRLIVPGNFASAPAFTTIPQPNFAWSKSSGLMGGGQVGYNWQVTDRVVVGFETDFQGVASGGNSWNSGWMSSASTHGPSSIGTVRGRAGYLVTPNLQVYGTGGMAYGAGN